MRRRIPARGMAVLALLGFVLAAGDGKRGTLWRMTRFAQGDPRLPPGVTGTA